MIFTHVAQDQAYLNCEWIGENKPITLRWKRKRRTGWSTKRSCVYGPDGKIGRCNCFTKPRKCIRAPGPEVNLASSCSAVPRSLRLLGCYIICWNNFISLNEYTFWGLFFEDAVTCILNAFVFKWRKRNLSPHSNHWQFLQLLLGWYDAVKALE